MIVGTEVQHMQGAELKKAEIFWTGMLPLKNVSVLRTVERKQVNLKASTGPNLDPKFHERQSGVVVKALAPG